MLMNIMQYDMERQYVSHWLEDVSVRANTQEIRCNTMLK